MLALRTFSTEQEAVTLANDSPYGLGHAVMSTDVERAERVGNLLQV